MARALDANGSSKVFIIGRRERILQETAASAVNGSIIPVTGDVTSKESLQAAYDIVASQTDHIDLLVANSGTAGPNTNTEIQPDCYPTLSEFRDQLWSIPMEEFTNVSHVNVTGSFYTIVAFLPLLEAQNKKRPAPVPGTVSSPKPQVIITSSIAGFTRLAFPSFPYNLSKAAVTHMLKMLATTLSQYEIRVNGITPGLYRTDMSLPFYESQGVPGNGTEDGSFPRSIVPVTRSGSEEDMAGVILWMAGAAGGYLNGNIVVSDGGSVSVMPSTY
ncbi:SDR family oxidoreductase [Aspergillus foveolatus]|uniref:SDR family oxidoreductase n=1 Tax=Aspergillus foveolatus TaxID=210207 RepID=UPI003CCCE686